MKQMMQRVSKIAVLSIFAMCMFLQTAFAINSELDSFSRARMSVSFAVIGIALIGFLVVELINWIKGLMKKKEKRDKE